MHTLHHMHQMVGNVLHIELPDEFANCTVQVTVQRSESVEHFSQTQPKRQPPAHLAGSVQFFGDIVAPIVDAADWNLFD